MTKYKIAFGFIYIFLAVTLHAEEFRTWKNNAGKSIEAIFLNFDEENEIVQIRMKSGKEQRVKLSLFSDEDQRWVRNGGKETTDDPFGDATPQEPLRIIFSISEFGDCKYSIEKTTKPFTDEFDGIPITVSSLAKTKISKNSDGVLKMIHDFGNCDDIGILFRRTNKSEIINGCLRTKITSESGGIALQYPRKIFLPLTLVFDLNEYLSTGFYIVLYPDEPVEKLDRLHQITLKQDFYKSDSGQVIFDFECYEFQKNVGKKVLVKDDNISLAEPAEKKFRLPVPNKKLSTGFYFEIAQSAEQKTMAFSQIIVTAPMGIKFDVQFKEKDGYVYAARVGASGTAGMAGMKEGDVIKSFNGKQIKKYMELREMFQKARFGMKNVFVVERGGKTVRIVTD